MMGEKRETRIRKWIGRHGVVLSRGTKRERRFTIRKQELELPRYRYDLRPVKLLPTLQRPGGWTRRRKEHEVWRVDLAGWESGRKNHTLVLAELKVGCATTRCLRQLMQYVNYAEWLLREMSPAEFGRFRYEDFDYPSLKRSPDIVGILLARDFEKEIYWSFPHGCRHEILLVRYALTDMRRKVGVADIDFFDETDHLAQHWTERGQQLRTHG